MAGPIVSEHSNRVVYDQGDHFVKTFTSTAPRDEELERLRWLEAAGVSIPKILDTSGTLLVTARIEGEVLEEIIRTRWATMDRKRRNAMIGRVAELCRKIRDAGFDWPDLVTYHIYVGEKDVTVLDPARLRKGRLDLSALYWSTAEPTVSRMDRLRFWRAYAGKKKPQRLRKISHRGRFRPYRWVVQSTAVGTLPPFADFVNAVDAPFSSVDEIASHPDLEIKRKLKGRTNAVLGDLVLKIVQDVDEARAEWENHRMLIASGWRVPQPAVGGILKDGRGLFATVRLEDKFPMDDVWQTLDRRKAVRACADIARRLHESALVHRDLYLCHFFVAKGDDRIWLIDLARLTKTRSARRRVKDLASLVHSAQGLVSRSDLWRGLRRYGGDKALARKVIKKAAKIARHVPRNVQDGTHVPHVPCE